MSFRRIIPILVFFTITALGAAAVHAHHSASASFTNNVTQAEGVVTEFTFANPHINIFFDVTDENGETTQWMATGGAANRLRQQGWTADTIQPGQYLRIEGREARFDEPMILISSVVELDQSGALLRVVEGESEYEEIVAELALTFEDGRPNLTGAWTTGPGAGMSGGGSMGYGPGAPYNEAGAVAAAAFDPVSDPAVACEDPGLVRLAGWTPHPVRVTQNDDHVVLDYEMYGGQRVIYFDGRAPETEEHTRLGHSVARYEGDTLIIESSHLLENYTGPEGNPISDEATIVETYRRMDVPGLGAALTMDMAITDPKYLTAPWTLSWQKFYTPEYEMIEVDCRVPFTYREGE